MYPLLGVPITDGERRLVQDRGAPALEARWARAGTDVLDGSRTDIALIADRIDRPRGRIAARSG
jgi:hypothetical protein